MKPDQRTQLKKLEVLEDISKKQDISIGNLRAKVQVQINDLTALEIKVSTLKTKTDSDGLILANLGQTLKDKLIL